MFFFVLGLKFSRPSAVPLRFDFFLPVNFDIFLAMCPTARFGQVYGKRKLRH